MKKNDSENEVDQITAGMVQVSLNHRVLLVLDLNGLLVHRIMQGKLAGADVSHAVTLGKFKVWTRPHVDAFIDFCLAHFDVGVWSSAMSHNVELLMKHVFGDRREQLLFEFDQSDCVGVKHSDPKEKKPLLKKPLERVWRKHPTYRERTLLLDDSQLKAQDNPPHTLFCPPEWTHDCSDEAINEALGEGGAVRTYLEGLLKWEGSVASYVESRSK